ncbi:MAG: DNA-3-methyladenine glycosylase I [Alcanivoracaceae bacterium]|nr:DNA-3-methyladenine glycosylase I [Alcanivoracaceae bacterium]
MLKFDEILETACLRKGGMAPIEATFPAVAGARKLSNRSDAWYMSAITRRIFRAGLKHSLVDARWPAFEEAFFGFDPEKLVLMPDAMLDERMQDARLIRHWGKMKAIRPNAQMVLDLSREHGGFGRFLAQWPVSDTVGLWRVLSKQGKQLGGNSAPMFLRMVERDSWVPTRDVVAALVGQGVIDKSAASQRDQKAAQQAFNQWQEESGRPQSHISRVLAFTVG